MTNFRFFPLKEKHSFLKMIFRLLLMILLPFWLNSCRTIENGCQECYGDKSNENVGNIIKTNEIYIIEFHKDFPKKSLLENGKVNTLKSCVKPTLKKDSAGTYIYSIIEISKESSQDIVFLYAAFLDEKINLEEYKKLSANYAISYTNRIILKDTTEIKNLSLSSDVDVPPSLTRLSIGDTCQYCPRDRKCISDKTIFDKIELRALAGYRINSNESVFYPGPDGGIEYPKETLGFGRGGTDIALGVEAAFLWDATSLIDGIFGIPKRNKFHLGPMIGLWPVDGSIFVPLSLHPRYTFLYDETDPQNCECDAWYVFGDFGVPIDPTFKVPIVCENCGDDKLWAYFWGFGVGRDWWISKCMDFSIDIGYRMTNTPLPSNTLCEECTNTVNKVPFRNVGQIFLRFGFTW